jgi:hypothetical protein
MDKFTTKKQRHKELLVVFSVSKSLCLTSYFLAERGHIRRGETDDNAKFVEWLTNRLASPQIVQQPASHRLNKWGDIDKRGVTRVR